MNKPFYLQLNRKFFYFAAFVKHPTMTTYVLLAGSCDGDEQDATCQSNQEEDAEQQGGAVEEMGNTDLEDSAAG